MKAILPISSITVTVYPLSPKGDRVLYLLLSPKWDRVLYTPKGIDEFSRDFSFIKFKAKKIRGPIFRVDFWKNLKGFFFRKIL